jgi:hypothetical protein
MIRALKILSLVTMLSTMLAAQGSARGVLEGAWRVAETVITGANASTTSNPQPGLFIFTRTHYSFWRVSGDQPRPLFNGDPTNDEKMMAFDSFAGTTGTYEVSGTTLTVRPVVARTPNCMGGAFLRYQFRVEGNTLSLTQKSTDVNCLIGQRALPSAPGSEFRWKLTRVE